MTRGRKILIIFLILFGPFIFCYTNPVAKLVFAIEADNPQEVEKALKICPPFMVNMRPFPSRLFCAFTERLNAYPLQRACTWGNKEIVQMLLDKGADVNVMDSERHSTPLICALNSGSEERFEIAWMLIERGADINVVNDYSDSPVGCSLIVTIDDTEKCQREGTELFLYLAEHTDKEILYTCWYTETVLELASAYNNLEAVKYLLENDCFDINYVSRRGTTALHWAAKEGGMEVCSYLLEHGADTDIVDEEGKTAYDYAVERGDAELIELFEEWQLR